MAGGNCQVTVILPSEKQIEIAGYVYKQHNMNGTFKKSENFEMDYPDKSFDLVWNFCVTHILDSEKIIDNMVRISRKYVMIIVPNLLNYGFLLHKIDHLLTGEPWIHGNINYMNIPKIKSALEKRGMSVKQTFLLDVPFWPDIDKPIETVIGNFIPFLKKWLNNRAKERYKTCSHKFDDLPYFTHDPAFEKLMAKLSFIERYFPEFIRVLFAHHNGVIARNNELFSLQETDNTLALQYRIMAYNEGANIGHLLKSLTEQKLSSVTIKEIIVIASGCIDNTEEIVKNYISSDNRVRLLVQKERKGKASAVNLFLREATEKILVLESADTLPHEDYYRKILVTPFSDSNIGMTGAHPVPVNKNNDFTGFSVNLLWELHHQLSLYYPKMGELIAFRNIFYKIPENTSVDEASIEPLIKGQGFQILYVPEAIVINKGAEHISDFIRVKKKKYLQVIWL